jgi:hypothetical protein
MEETVRKVGKLSEGSHKDTLKVPYTDFLMQVT